MKRSFILSLVIVMLFACMPCAFAASDFVIDENGVLTGYNGSSASVVIPAGVTKIGKHVFSGNNTIKSVVIPAGVTMIDELAFEACTSLVSVTLPASLTTLGYGAFYQCSALETLELPSGVTAISPAAFSECASLKTIALPEGVTDMGLGMFAGCVSLESIQLPSTLTGIGTGAFERCAALKTLDIPSGVATIGAQAFSGCRALESIRLPESITTVKYRAFYGCDALYEVFLPDNITTVEAGVFSFNTAVKCMAGSVTENTLTTAEYAFNHIEIMELPESVEIIDAEAFENVDAEYVIIPSGCEEIGARAFADCAALVRVDIPATVTAIATDAFSGSSRVVIYAPAGSFAEEYADARGIAFRATAE